MTNRFSMASSKQHHLTIDDFHAVVADIRTRFPHLAADDLFVLWFLRAYVTERESKASEAILGGAKDKGVDAILIDDAMRCVFVVQAKYRQSLGEVAEKRNDVVTLGEIAGKLSNASNEEFTRFTKSTDALVSKALLDARERILKRGYRLWVYFLTLGNVSNSIRDDAQSSIQTASCNVGIEIIDARRAVILLRDYLDGVAPPIPALDLEMGS